MLNIKNVLQQGEPGKYQVIIDYDGFSMRENDFRIRLYWGMKGDYIDIEKADMLQDEDGRFYIQFDTTEMTALVRAEVIAYLPDTDTEEGIRPLIERVPLCWVNTSDRMPVHGSQQSYLYDGQHVQFMRTTSVGVKSLYFYLRDIVGVYLCDQLGRQLKALKKPRVS